VARSWDGKKTKPTTVARLRRWRSHTTQLHYRYTRPRWLASTCLGRSSSPRFSPLTSERSVLPPCLWDSERCKRCVAAVERARTCVCRRRATFPVHPICVMQATPSLSRLPISQFRELCPRKGECALDYMEVLRLLTINDERFADDYATGVASAELDPKTLALVRLGALVAVGGAAPSYGAEADAAVSAGATESEIVDVLLGVVSVVGRPCVVAAAPSLALALGYDINDALEQMSAL
jgi:4-carboxymuconolactone decarboxylase